jgi:hypothetical protein
LIDIEAQPPTAVTSRRVQAIIDWLLSEQAEVDRQPDLDIEIHIRGGCVTASLTRLARLGRTRRKKR